MSDFRTILKPGALRTMTLNGSAYRAVLRLTEGDNVHVVWFGPHHLIAETSAAEAKQRAIADAEYVLACDDGSLMAEELAALVA